MPREVNLPSLTPDEMSKLGKKALAQRLIAFQDRLNEQGKKYGALDSSFDMKDADFLIVQKK